MFFITLDFNLIMKKVTSVLRILGYSVEKSGDVVPSGMAVISLEEEEGEGILQLKGDPMYFFGDMVYPENASLIKVTTRYAYFRTMDGEILKVDINEFYENLLNALRDYKPVTKDMVV